MKKLSEREERFNLFSAVNSEITKVVSGITKFGWESRHPKRSKGPTNKEQLETKIGELCAILSFMADAGDIDENRCAEAEAEKTKAIVKAKLQ